MTDTTLYQAYQFFKHHAGYCVGRSAQGALAKAERWAKENAMKFVWAWDDCGDLGDHAVWCADMRRFEAGYNQEGEALPRWGRRAEEPACDHNVEYCRAVWHRATLASLSGIIDADRTYRRIVEAELAQEAMQDATEFAYY